VKDLIKELYENTKRGNKVFIRQGEQTHKVIKNVQMFIYNNQEKFALDKYKKLTFHGLCHFYCQSRYNSLLNSGLTDLQARNFRRIHYYRNRESHF